MAKRQMLINYVPGEECRIAIVEDGLLEELYQERASSESHVGNIYKGRVTNVEPSIQAAFVDFGLERNGFLHISDLHPKYFPGQSREQTEKVGEKTPRRDRPPIQKCLRRGQEVLVQVLKEGIGTKGPTLTSYLSIPGRYLVMMLHMERLGVSRKVEDDDARREMRKVLDELDPPDGFGFIIRTAGVGRTKTELKRDLAYLQRLWKNIERRRTKLGPVGELYTESDLVIRTIRDVYSSDIERIIVDNEQAARRAVDFLAIANPRTRPNVLVYRDVIPLFHRYDIERQIENINARTVPLPSGGSLVIDSTEALVAIDVNSGKMRDHRDADTTAYKTNLEAVDEICRQLRLRDLGGVVVNDLIDMRDLKHRRAVEQRFRNNLKKDRARTRVAAISPFGLLEMTRQRMRPSLKHSLYVSCEHCGGTGAVKSSESVVLDVMRRLALALSHPKVVRVELTVSPDVAFQLLNRKRTKLVRLEQRHDAPVMVRVNAQGPADFMELQAYDSRGSLLDDQVVAADRGDDIEASLIDVHELRAQKAETADPRETDELEPQADEDLVADEQQAQQDQDSDLDQQADEPDESEQAEDSQAAEGSNGSQNESGDSPSEGNGKRRRRRRRGGRRRRRGSRRNGDEGDNQPLDGQTEQTEQAEDASPDAPPREDAAHQADQPQQPTGSDKPSDADRAPGGSTGRRTAEPNAASATSSRDSQQRAPQPGDPGQQAQPAEPGGESQADADGSQPPADAAQPPKPRRRRRSRSRRSSSERTPTAQADPAASPPSPGEAGEPMAGDAAVSRQDKQAVEPVESQPKSAPAPKPKAPRSSDSPADTAARPASASSSPAASSNSADSEPKDPAADEQTDKAPPRKRRRRRRTSRANGASGDPEGASDDHGQDPGNQQQAARENQEADAASVPSN